MATESEMNAIAKVLIRKQESKERRVRTERFSSTGEIKKKYKTYVFSFYRHVDARSFPPETETSFPPETETVVYRVVLGRRLSATKAKYFHKSRERISFEECLAEVQGALALVERGELKQGMVRVGGKELSLGQAIDELVVDVEDHYAEISSDREERRKERRAKSGSGSKIEILNLLEEKMKAAKNENKDKNKDEKDENKDSIRDILEAASTSASRKKEE